MAHPNSISAVIPAVNEASSIADVVNRLSRAARWHEIIVVDDGSEDATADHALQAGAMVVKHPYTKGNGAAIKTGIRLASGEFVLVLDADGQHAPEDAVRLTRRLGEFDLVVGSRAGSSHASATRRVGNAFLSKLASYLTAHPIPDLTSGFRCARRERLLEFMHLLPNGFSTPTTTTLAFVKAGYNVAFEPVQVHRRQGASKVHFARDGARFCVILLRVIMLFSPMRIFAPISALSFLLGGVYGLVSVLAGHPIPNGAVLLLLFSIMVFLIGLISEQISTLWIRDGDGRR